GQVCGSYCQDMQPALEHLLYRGAKQAQVPHFCGVGTQAIADAPNLPTEAPVRLNRHEPMANLADHVTGGIAGEVLVFDLLEELRTGGSPAGVRLEVIGKDVGINEYRIAGRQVAKVYGCSGGGG